MDQYDQTRRNLAEAQSRMRAMRATAKSSDGTVSVTVDFRGNLTAVEFSPRAYQRYSPSLLAEETLRLTGRARAEVTGRMAEVMAPFLPREIDYSALMSGDVDPAELAFPAPLTDENYDEWRARFSGRPSTVPPDPGPDAP
jgi:DNA-binding protein YbaB